MDDTQQAEQNLRILAICHYVYAAFAVCGSAIGVVYVFLGQFITRMPTQQGRTPPPAEMLGFMQGVFTAVGVILTSMPAAAQGKGNGAASKVNGSTPKGHVSQPKPVAPASSKPATPPGLPINNPALKGDAESVTFSITQNPNGNAVLHIHVPEPNFLDALGAKGAASQIPMIKTLLGGARVLLAVEPEGTLVRTTSPFVDGGRVTLLEVDLDEVLKDETLIARLKAATTQDEAKAAVRAAAGVKINLDREITVEFTPAK